MHKYVHEHVQRCYECARKARHADAGRGADAHEGAEAEGGPEVHEVVDALRAPEPETGAPVLAPGRGLAPRIGLLLRAGFAWSKLHT